MAARWARPFTSSGVLHGMAGGALGALTLLLCTLSLRLMDGQDGWLVPKLYAFPLMGSAALREGFEAGPVLAGLVVFFGAATGLGGLLGAALDRAPADLAVCLGGSAGLLLWLVAKTWVWPRLPASWASHLADLMPAWVVLIQFLLLGLSIGSGVAACPLLRDSWRRLRWRMAAGT